MRYWLARLSFSFFIVGVFLVYEGYQAMTGQRGEVEAWRIAVLFAGAVMSIALGFAGIRERHLEVRYNGENDGENDEVRNQNDE